jgi:hypothetical protein
MTCHAIKREREREQSKAMCTDNTIQRMDRVDSREKFIPKHSNEDTRPSFDGLADIGKHEVPYRTGTAALDMETGKHSRLFFFVKIVCKDRFHHRFPDATTYTRKHVQQQEYSPLTRFLMEQERSQGQDKPRQDTRN